MTTMTIDPRMTKARTLLIQHQPFFGTLALYLQLVWDDTVETMATDGKHLFYSLAFLNMLTPLELLGVIAHEVLHCAYQHHLRRQWRDPEKWNIACDYCVNRDLVAAGFTLPKGALLDGRFNGMGAEEVYARLYPPQASQPQPQQGSQQPQNQPATPQQNGQQPGQQQPGQGNSQQQKPGQGQSPAGSQQAPGSQPGQAGNQPRQPGAAGSQPGPGSSMGRVLDGAGPGESAKHGEQVAEWERRVRQAVSVAAGRNAGKIPGEFSQLVKETGKSKVSWTEQTRNFIDSRAEYQYSWSRPNRRFAASGIIMPSGVPDTITKLGIVNDSSGSVDEKLYANFMAELQAVLDERIVQEVVVIQCDTRVQHVARYETGDTISSKIVGRGGTNFSPALEWFEQNEPDVAAIIYFTDLMTSDFGHEPACPLLWAAYGYESQLEALAHKVPFGEVIKVLP